jgi:hypothetical protein
LKQNFRAYPKFSQKLTDNIFNCNAIHGELQSLSSRL